MTKQAFLDALQKGLSDLQGSDVEECVRFYSEMIDDRMEEGYTEQDAVEKMGSIEEIVEQSRSDTLLKIGQGAQVPSSIKKGASKKGQLPGWVIVLLVVGAPVWLSLLLSAVAVVLSFYAALWSLIVSLWTVFVTLAALCVGGVVSGVLFAVESNLPAGFALIGGGLFCAGLAILCFFASKGATKGTIFLTRRIAGALKRCYKKEAL